MEQFHFSDVEPDGGAMQPQVRQNNPRVPAPELSLDEELAVKYKVVAPLGPLILQTDPNAPICTSKFDEVLDVVTIKTAKITSSNIVTMSQSAERPSRAIRQFRTHVELFLRVTFRADEELIDGSGKRKSSTPGLNWFARVYQAIKHGILIDGRMYHFLCYSASNLRARKAWFLQLHKPTGQPLTCTSVLRGLGDFSLSASTIGKFVARIGQCFSKTTETVRVNKSKISVIPDSISSVNGKLYCSTDGCGEISASLAAQIALQLGLLDSPNLDLSQKENTLELIRQGKIPSAFQIRFAGAKGVLVINPQIADDGPVVRLRPSMIKFYAPPAGSVPIEAIKWSGTSSSASLNAQVIVLLHALGVNASVFVSLLEAHLDRVDSLSDWNSDFIAPDAKAFVSFLDVFALVCQGFSKRDQYIRNTIEGVSTALMDKLEKKLSIPVKRSRRALGVADPTGQLKPGTVFFQHSVKDSPIPQMIVGKIVVTRNPCYHPGDVRVLEAVACPALADLADVLVFPRMDENVSARPHSDEMAGGDLDGDEYLILWEPTLLPPTLHEPADYGAYNPASATSQIFATNFSSLGVNGRMLQNIKAFYIKYILSLDKIGLLDRLYFQWVDRFGALEARPLEISKLLSVALDSAKTGEDFDIPARLANGPRDASPEHGIRRVLQRIVMGRWKRWEATLSQPKVAPAADLRLALDQKDLVLLDTYENYLTALRSVDELGRTGIRARIDEIEEHPRMKLLKQLFDQVRELRRGYNQRMRQVLNETDDAASSEWIGKNMLYLRGTREFVSAKELGVRDLKQDTLAKFESLYRDPDLAILAARCAYYLTYVKEPTGAFSFPWIFQEYLSYALWGLRPSVDPDGNWKKPACLFVDKRFAEASMWSSSKRAKITD